MLTRKYRPDISRNRMHNLHFDNIITVQFLSRPPRCRDTVFQRVFLFFFFRYHRYVCFLKLFARYCPIIGEGNDTINHECCIFARQFATSMSPLILNVYSQNKFFHSRSFLIGANNWCDEKQIRSFTATRHHLYTCPQFIEKLLLHRSSMQFLLLINNVRVSK